MSTLMHNTPPISEKSVNNNETIHYKMGNTADIDSSAYPTKSYRKKHTNYQNGGSVSPRRRFNNQSQNNNNNNQNQSKRNHPNNNYNHSRRNSQNDGNNNVNVNKNPPKPRENPQKPVKPNKTDQESHESSPASSQRSVSPAPSTTSNSFTVSSSHNKSTSSTASDDTKKPSQYSQEFLHLVRQQMEDISLSPQKNGKNQILVQQNGDSSRKNEMEMAALRIALSGIASDNCSNYYLGGHFLYHPVQHTSPQKQQQIYQQSWTFPRGGGYPVQHYQHNYHRSNYYNRSNYNYHQEDQQSVCKCLYPARNSNNAIFCIQCRYPVKKHPTSFGQNPKRFSHRNSMNNSNYHNNSYHNQNRSNNNNNPNRNSFHKNPHDIHESSNENYNGKNFKKFNRNQNYLKPQDPPKSLSPTPTPSTSSKSESPTIDNPQNDSGSAKSITFGNFDLPLDDYPSSNSSSSCSSSTTQSQLTLQNNQEYDSYNRQPQHQQPQQVEYYLPDAQQLQPHQSPTSYGFWVNCALQHPTSYQNLQPYQPQAQPQQQFNNEGDTQSYQKKRSAGRQSPNIYPNTISLSIPATIPGYNNSSLNARKSPPINGFRVPFLYPQDNPNYCPSDRFLARSHLVEIRETPKNLLNDSKWDPLTQDIWSKFLQYQQTEETYRKKMLLWRQLYNIVKQRFLEKTHPKNGLYLVGSTISGFGADSSDIDMCLVANKTNSIDPRTEALVHLSYLESHIKESDGFEQFCLIQARVPILRFKDSNHLLEVDLNWNNCVGIRNTHLLYCYSQMDWRLRPLALIVKLWAQHHNINDAKNSTISSYSLVLMVIHFLQFAVSPPVLPCLHVAYPEKFQIYHDISNIDMVEELEPIQSDNKQPLGELFVEFLKYYSHFEYSKYAISIRVGSTLPIEECRIVRNCKNDPNHWKTLCIEEPFDLTNTARSVYDEETFENIKHVFYLSWCKLRENLDLNAAVFAQPLFQHTNGMYPMPPTPSVSPTIQNGDGYANFDTKLS